MLDRQLIKEKLKDKSVLFVDDDTVISFSWGKLLERSFGKVYIANNGRDGLQLYKSNRVDVIVTDITMPIMNGLDMVKEIQGIDKDCKIIFMTGHNELEYIEKMTLLGGISLIKPVDMEEFFKVVLEIL